jgi:hypothetical protein
LTVGNRYVYALDIHRYPQFKPDTIHRYTETVVRDTLINGTRYAVIFSTFENGLRYERSNDTAMFVWKNGREQLQYNWNIKNGDSINFSHLGWTHRGIASLVDRSPATSTSNPFPGDSLLAYLMGSGIYDGQPPTVDGQSAALKGSPMGTFVVFRKALGITQAEIYLSQNSLFALGLDKNSFFRIYRNLQGAVIRGILFGDTNSTAKNISPVQEIPILATALKNIPNPFTESVSLEYTLASAAPDVELRVTGMNGETLAVLKHGAQGTGKHSIEWNGKTTDGRDVPQGAYMVSLYVNGRKQNDVKVMKAR